MNGSIRVYRRLLRLYPAPFRERYEQEMVRVFAEQLRDAHQAGSDLAVLSLWARTLVDLIVTVPFEHLRVEEPVPRPVDVVVPDVTSVRPRPKPRPLHVGLAVAPFAVWLAMAVFLPERLEPAFDPAVSIIGLPAGAIGSAIAFGLAALGLLGVRRGRTPAVAVVSIVLCSLPAVLLILLVPAAIEIVKTLKV